jgi:tetratricopeptide (TPR) repeat protein
MPAYRLRAGGSDMLRNFVISIPLAGTRFVKAWEFLPGNARVVHHATMQFDQSWRSRQLDAEDADPGYEGLIAHGAKAPDGYFLDWGPGHTPYIAPEGMAWLVRGGTDLVMTLHLRPSGKEETVQASVGLYFSETPPLRTPTIVRLTRQHLDIPAGESKYIVTDSFKLDVGVSVYSIQPHAHYLAKQVNVVASLPDGSTRPLLYIPKWNFNWQGVYTYADPVTLPRGTTIGMEWIYDNSIQNPSNPSLPPKRVTYGQQTSDEMSEVWLQVVASDSDRHVLFDAVSEKVLREEIVGHEKMLEKNPHNVALHDDVALMYVQLGDIASATAHFLQSLTLDSSTPQRPYNVGLAWMMQGQWLTARGYFERALALEPAYVPALTELAWILATSPERDGRLRQPDLALRYINDAARVAQQPTARIMEVLAAALAAAGQYASAADTAETALRLVGDDTATEARLRSSLAEYRVNRPYIVPAR